MNNLNSKEVVPESVSGCYLLCFADNPVAHALAKHYLGYAINIAARVEKHRSGTAARLTSVLVERGGKFVVSRVWEGYTEAEEAKLKGRRMRKPSPAMKSNHKRGSGVAKHCPICKQRKKEMECIPQ